MKTAEQRLADRIAEIKDPDIRAILSISETSRKYPKDCIADGGLERLVAAILRLERGA